MRCTYFVSGVMFSISSLSWNVWFEGSHMCECSSDVRVNKEGEFASCLKIDPTGRIRNSCLTNVKTFIASGWYRILWKVAWMS
jgi:hypothetical protein